MTKAKYERELQGILEGNEEVVESVTSTCSESQIENYSKIYEIPFVTVRSAGSRGIDILALRGEISFPIEVKSSKKKNIYFAGNTQLIGQIKKLKNRCSSARTVPLYAYRRKGVRGEKWKLYTILDLMDDVEIIKKHEILSRKLQEIESTNSNNLKLNWRNGMPLNEFIIYIHYLLY